MSSLMKFFLSLSLLLGGINGALGSNNLSQPKKNPKLFVFGDNYADTGNMEHNAISWKSPYGITFPGKPSGRYSDGLIATDFLAKAIGANSPYLWKTHGRTKLKLKNGMNFAFGGSRVFDNMADRPPNMSTQANFMVDFVLASRVYTFNDLTFSDLAILSYSGNDYFEYIAENPKFSAFPAFIQDIMAKIKYTMWILDGITFKNIAVTSLQPIGCLPHYTSASSFKSCNESYSELVKIHNNSLKKVVSKLNEEARERKKAPRNFFIIDIHNAFTNVLNNKGSTKFKNPLKPCCEGECANVDTKGAKKYTLCNDPKSYFFWDKFNPTQEGWKTIYSVIGNPLAKSMTKG